MQSGFAGETEADAVEPVATDVAELSAESIEQEVAERNRLCLFVGCCKFFNVGAVVGTNGIEIDVVDETCAFLLRT